MLRPRHTAGELVLVLYGRIPVESLKLDVGDAEYFAYTSPRRSW
jgi:hypothetical protein